MRRPGDMRRSLTAALLLPLLLAGAAPVMAESSADRQAQIKSAFILNIARFVSWRETALVNDSDHLTLCFREHNPYGEATATIVDRMVGERRLAIRVIDAESAADGCHILFIPAAKLWQRQTETPRDTLTVTDLTDDELADIHRGRCMVALVRDGQRINFEVNLDAVQAAGLRISSELLKLGRIVTP